MDAHPSETANLSYTDPPPVVLAASSHLAMTRAEQTIEAHGLRIGARLPIEDALERIQTQAAATAIWVELDRDGGGAMDALLEQLRNEAEDGRYGAVVSVTAPSNEALQALIDPVSARVDDSSIELLANADQVDRVTALASVMAKSRVGGAVADASNDRNAERLRQLSEEVNRIASTLARLSAGPGISRQLPESLATGEIPPLSADTVLKVIRARRLRARYFSEELFADPAWDMLLDLLQAEIAQLRVPVSSLCIAAAVPATTALRWMKTLVSEGLFIRRADPHDGRRVFVELAPATSEALRRYFAEVEAVPVI